MGAGTTFRLAGANPDLFAAACCVSGGGRGSGAEQFATTPLLLLHGEGDTVNPVDRARALDARLTELNLVHELRTFPSHGHEYHSEQYINLTLDFFEKVGPKKR
jgi:predicted esterase